MLPVAATLALALVPAQAGDWPCFGGPNRDNRVPALDTDYAWGPAGPEVRWRVATGPGFGGAAVRDGEVFLFDRVLGESDVLRVFDLATGAERWRVVLDAPGRLTFPGSRSVPLVTADAVYASGGFGHVACFDRETRDTRWALSMAETFGAVDPGFGFSSSPVLAGGRVVFSPLSETVGLVAFEPSGEQAWATEPVGYSHSTPVLMDLLGREQLLILSTTTPPKGQDEAAPMRITSFDPADGSTLWSHEVLLSRMPIPGPTRIDDERFLVTGGYRGGTRMLRLEEGEGGFALAEVFASTRGAQIHQPLLHGEFVYLVVNENWNTKRNLQAEGGLMCLGLDGEERWRTGNAPYLGRGSLLLAGEHLLLQDGGNGVLRVIRAQPTGYEEVATADLFESSARDGQMWAPMALAGDLLLLRSQEQLVCADLSTPARAADEEER